MFIKLCGYGCGKEAKFPPKKGMTKWCCEENWQSCPTIKKNLSTMQKELWKNPEIRKNRIKVAKESHNRQETKEKHSKAKIFTIEQIKEKHPLFFQVEEMRYNSNRERQVHCHNHNCPNSKEKGGWFTPTKSQIYERIKQLEYNDGSEGSNFYCSEHCKQTCLVYGKKVSQLIKEDEIRAGIITEENPTGELQIFREEVLRRQKEELEHNECQYCENQNLEELVVHHEYPRKTHPQFELDPDNGVVCCGLNSKNKCHIKYGHRSETPCSTGNLSNIICMNKNIDNIT